MKSLITITTCNRLIELRKYILSYISLVRANSDFELLISVDGNNPEYLDFCSKYSIPLIYSEHREGVGLSKNRVLKSFPQYDHYFFIEDDIELFDSSIFQDVVNVASMSGFHHFTITELRYISQCLNFNSYEVLLGEKGGAQFSYYSKESLNIVGGWHTLFAKYRRFGHTEHSYRYVNAGLQPKAFICIKNCLDKIIIHDPPHVTHIDMEMNELEISKPEEELMDQRLNFFPITTLSTFDFNAMSMSYPGNELITKALESKDRYYLVSNRKEKRHARVEFKVFELGQKVSLLYKVRLLVEIVCLAPTNNAFKHWVKTSLKLT